MYGFSAKSTIAPLNILGLLMRYFAFIFAASLITSRKTSMITTRGTSRIKDLALVVRKKVARPTRKVAQMTSLSTTKMEVDEKVVKRWAAKISV